MSIQKRSRYEFYRDAKGEFRWRKFAANGTQVGSSGEGFKNKTGVIRNAQLNGYTGEGKTGWV